VFLRANRPRQAMPKAVLRERSQGTFTEKGTT